MMNSKYFDVIVIGGGINGSYAALQTAMRGKRTAIVEQFPLPHSRGSSGGQTRIIRLANSGPFPLTHIMADSYRQWKQLEAEGHCKLIRESPLMVICDESDTHDIDRMHRAIFDCNKTPKWWNIKDFNDKFGTNFSKDQLILEDPTGGILMADKCLQTIQKQFVALGGTILDEFPVSAIRSQSASIVVVEGAKESLKSSALIVCAGSWTRRLLRPHGVDIPLKPVKAGVYYWTMKVPVEEKFSFVDLTREHIYGLPQIEYPNMVKICFHDGPSIDPDRRELANLSEIKEMLQNYVSLRFPNLIPIPSIEESCIYTNSPDNEMIIDQIPGHPNIAFASGFSGTGFKTAPTVGTILSELVLRIEPSFQIDNFRLKRFENSKSSKL